MTRVILVALITSCLIGTAMAQSTMQAATRETDASIAGELVVSRRDASEVLSG